MLSLCLVIQSARGMREPPLGFCLVAIVNGKPLDLEKTTYTVLICIVINLCSKVKAKEKLYPTVP